MGIAANSSSRRASGSLPAFVVLLLLATLLQWLSGAFFTGFTGYPDESAHFVTTAMVREYVLQGLPGRPLAFAEDYYQHYPKVGFGHWPPLFYAVASMWTMAAPHSRIWFLLLMAGFTAATGCLLARGVARIHGWVAGSAMGAAFVMIPAVQAQTGMVMLETLLTLTALCAGLCFTRFLETGTWRDSVAFGWFAALTILTKGNGWALALVPPMAIALTRRWRLWRGAALWMAIIPVAVLCGPWQYFTRRMADQGWEQPYPTVSYTAVSLARFARVCFGISPPLFLLALLGLGIGVVLPVLGGRAVEPFRATMAALLAAVWIFHAVVPTGVEDRKIIMGLCGVLAFVPDAVEFIALRWRRWLPPAAVAGSVAGLFLLWGFFIPAKAPSAFPRAAGDLLTRPDLGGTCLVSSDGDGEGYLISEIVLRQPRPSRFFLRATKMVARTDWSGHESQPLYGSESEMMGALDSIPVDVLIVDQTPGRFHFQHQRLLRAMVLHHPEKWRLVDSVAGANGEPSPAILIYSNTYGKAYGRGQPRSVLLHPVVSSALLSGSVR